MKTRVKFSSLLILTFCLLALFACGGDEESAVISISLGVLPSPGKAAVSIDQLVHVITLSGPSGTQTMTITGSGTAKATVVAGTWSIRVEAYFGEEIYAVGSATAEVKAGKNTDVMVQMTVVWTEPETKSGGGGGGGGVAPTNPTNPIAPIDPTIAIAIGFEGGTDPARGFNDALPSGLDLSYELVLINSASPSLREEIAVDPATGTASRQVSPGSYIVEVSAKVNGWDYAECTVPAFDVSSGETKNVAIEMQRMPSAVVLNIPKDEFFEFASIPAGDPLPAPKNLDIYNFTGEATVTVTPNSPLAGSFTWPGSPISIARDSFSPLSIVPTSTATAVYEDSLTLDWASYSRSIGVSFIAYPSTYITTQTELEAIRGNLGGSYELGWDITLSGSWTPIGDNSTGDNTTRFTGTLDGGGFTINLGTNIVGTVTGSSGDIYSGLFGYIGTGGEVKNLALVGALTVSDTSATTHAGPVAGYSVGTIRNVSSSVDVTIDGTGANTMGKRAGGIAGTSGSGASVTIINCYSTGTISVSNPTVSSGSSIVAGIAYTNSNISYCWASGALSSTSANFNNAGGIAYINTGYNVSNCVALNPSITASYTRGRVISSSTGTDNYANEDMLLQGSIITTGATTNNHGANVSAGPGGYEDDTWWNTPAPSGPGWTVNGSPVDENDPWWWDTGNNRPILWFEMTVNE